MNDSTRSINFFQDKISVERVESSKMSTLDHTVHSDSEWDFWFVNFFVEKSCSEIRFLHTTGVLRHQGSQKNLKRPKKFLKGTTKAR